MKKRRPYDRSGDKNPKWRGGRRYFQGYYMVYVPGHPSACKNYVLEHRLVMEKHLGRYLKTDELVHHINHDKSDNRIKNLELMTQATHASHHHRGNSYNPPRFSPIVAARIRRLYFSNPKRSGWAKKGNRYSVIALAKRFNCGRTTILDAIHRQDAYAR